MSDKRRFLDVWIVEIEKVYREVPYNVVVDWVQQGRLLEDDRLRPSGTAEWMRLGDYADVQPYLPKPTPHRADDEAEALEPVQLDFEYRKHHDEEDDDVDMIPLIDVSLVLLVFFMMTSAGGAAAYPIRTPVADFGQVAEADGIMLGIDLVEENGQQVPLYAISEGKDPPRPEDRGLRSRDELLRKLDEKLHSQEMRFPVTIHAHEDVEAGVVSDLIADLQTPDRRGRIVAKFTGVREKAP